jgi:hypothetical protein
MRIWDISPGYLNRQSLLGEHRELHGIVSIIINKKKGYSKHPETLRWVRYGWALRKRHQLLVSEMELRGYSEQSPVRTRRQKGEWPEIFIDPPIKQYQILWDKYQHKDSGRIPLPQNAQQLWRHHKYSVMARDINLYKEIGPTVAQMKPSQDFSDLALYLCKILRQPPHLGNMRNALLHMWGYVSDNNDTDLSDINSWALQKLFRHVQKKALTSNHTYLLESIALSELKVWINKK